MMIVKYLTGCHLGLKDNVETVWGLTQRVSTSWDNIWVFGGLGVGSATKKNNQNVYKHLHHLDKQACYGYTRFFYISTAPKNTTSLVFGFVLPNFTTIQFCRNVLLSLLLLSSNPKYK